MKVTAYEHDQALAACAVICTHYPDREAIPPHADRALVLLNQLAGAHACNEHVSYLTYSMAMREVERWRSPAGPDLGKVPAYTVECEDGPAMVVRTETRRYSVTRKGAQFCRGQFTGQSLDDVMRGAA